MIAHLSAEQIECLLGGTRDAVAERHLARCARCAEALSQAAKFEQLLLLAGAQLVHLQGGAQADLELQPSAHKDPPGDCARPPAASVIRLRAPSRRDRYQTSAAVACMVLWACACFTGAARRVTSSGNEPYAAWACLEMPYCR